MDTVLESLYFGCMGLGGSWDHQALTKEDEIRAFEALDAAIENGFRKFDHADIYTYGKAESVFGHYLANLQGLRESLYIQTKAGIQLHVGPYKSNRYNNSRSYLEKALLQSLKRLQIDYVDQFLIHRPDPLTPIQVVAENLEYLVQQGLTKSVGVSNMSTQQIQALQANMDTPLATNQIRFSLGHPKLLEDEIFFNRNEITDNTNLGLMSYAQAAGLSIQSWSPLDKGIYLADSGSDDSLEKQTYTFLGQLSEKYGVPRSAVLLAWQMKLPLKIEPIIGTTRPDRIQEAALAESITLDHADWYDLWIYARGGKLP
jgi:predicted oxidoreductase